MGESPIKRGSGKYHPMSPTSIVLFRSSSAVAQANTTNPLIWKVNWAMVAMGKYAIADPNDPGELLYLSPREYISFLKTSIANDSTLLIIAHPSDEQPAERDIKAKKPNSPPSEWDNRRLSGWAGLGSRIRRQFSVDWIPKLVWSYRPREILESSYTYGEVPYGCGVGYHRFLSPGFKIVTISCVI
jgi:hypothetical protein